MALACAVEPAALSVPEAHPALPPPPELEVLPPPPLGLELVVVPPPLEPQAARATDPAAISAAIETRRIRLTTSPSLTGVDLRLSTRTLGTDCYLLLTAE
jgi:hypothetical protein